MAIEPGDSAAGRELARKSAAARKPLPDPGTITILDLLKPWGLDGESWAAWRVFLKALYALPLDATELVVYQRHTGRTTPPVTPVRECWCIAGRRSGKSRIASVVAAFGSVFQPHRFSY